MSESGGLSIHSQPKIRESVPLNLNQTGQVRLKKFERKFERNSKQSHNPLVNTSSKT